MLHNNIIIIYVKNTNSLSLIGNLKEKSIIEILKDQYLKYSFLNKVYVTYIFPSIFRIIFILFCYELIYNLIILYV